MKSSCNNMSCHGVVHITILVVGWKVNCNEMLNSSIWSIQFYSLNIWNTDFLVIIVFTITVAVTVTVGNCCNCFWFAPQLAKSLWFREREEGIMARKCSGEGMRKGRCHGHQVCWEYIYLLKNHIQVCARLHARYSARTISAALLTLHAWPPRYLNALAESIKIPTKM